MKCFDKSLFTTIDMISLKSFISLSTTCLPALPTDLSKARKKEYFNPFIKLELFKFSEKVAMGG